MQLGQTGKSAPQVSDAVLIDPETDCQTRLGAMRELGTEEDLVLLETCAASTAERIRRNARKALEKLESE